jgi:hypothetical protein
MEIALNAVDVVRADPAKRGAIGFEFGIIF